MRFFNRAEKALSPQVTVILPAAGSSTRMKGVDKMLEDLGGAPVVIRTLQACESAGSVDHIVIVTRQEKIKIFRELCQKYSIKKVTAIVEGGNSRAESVQCGLRAMPKNSEFVAVHDAARPLVTAELIDNVVGVAKQTNAAILAIPVSDTLKRVVDGNITRTVKRTGIWRAQTPQVFDADLLRCALENARKNGVEMTDDASALEAMGVKVSIVDGSPINLKITTTDDLTLARIIYQQIGGNQ